MLAFDQFSETDYYFIVNGAYEITSFPLQQNYYHEVISQRPSPLLGSIRNLYAFVISQNDGMGYKASICMFNNRLQQYCDACWATSWEIPLYSIHSND